MKLYFNEAILLESGTFVNVNNKEEFELNSIKDGYVTLVDKNGNSQVWNFDDFVKCHIHTYDYGYRYGR